MAAKAEVVILSTGSNSSSSSSRRQVRPPPPSRPRDFDYSTHVFLVGRGALKTQEIEDIDFTEVHGSTEGEMEESKREGEREGQRKGHGGT